MRGGLALGGFDAQIDLTRIGLGAMHHERQIADLAVAELANTIELRQRPVGNAIVARQLRGTKARQKLRTVRRCIRGIEHIQTGVAQKRILLIDDGRIEFFGQHQTASGMGHQHDQGIGHGQVSTREIRPAPGRLRADGRMLGLGLIHRHQSTATGIAHQNDFAITLVAQMPYHRTDVDDTVLQQQRGFVADVARGHTHRIDAARCHIGQGVVPHEIGRRMDEHRHAVGAARRMAMTGTPQHAGNARHARLHLDPGCGHR